MSQCNQIHTLVMQYESLVSLDILFVIKAFVFEVTVSSASSRLIISTIWWTSAHLC
jgi:hypothetical protein